MSKNYKLTFEEYFKNGSSNWEIIESEDVVKNKYCLDEVFVDENTPIY